VAEELKQHFELNPISTDPEGCNRFSVRRNHLWKDSIRALSRFSFNCNKSIRVTFLGDSGVDEGGPGREYFYLTLQCVADDNSILQGPCGTRSFKHNPQALMEKKYFYAGQLIALSLANGGPGIPCLCEAVYSYLCYGLNLRVYPTMLDIPDDDIKEKLEQVRTSSPSLPSLCVYLYLWVCLSLCVSLFVGVSISVCIAISLFLFI
jgi:hypothetical protein